MDRNYGGVVWTNHALARLHERQIKQSDAWAVWRNPQKSRYDRQKDVWVYNRNYSGTVIEVVAKKNEKGEWLILSVWSKRIPTGSIKNKSSLWQILLKFIKKSR